jgi:hypothetical protein
MSIFKIFVLSQNIIRVTKSRMRQAGYVARMGEFRKFAEGFG